MRPLVWFRADLRTLDNPALHAACRDATRGVVAVFTICPEQWLKKHHLSDAKAHLILRTLGVLKADLEKLNVPLIVLEEPTFTGTPEALLELARKYRCDTLFFNDEYEWNERQRDERVTSLFRDNALDVRTFTDQTVFAPGTIRTGQDKFYSVFTPFKNAWIARHKEGAAADELPRPKRQPEMVTGTSAIPDGVDGFDASLSHADRWEAGEHAAQRRLKSFCAERIGNYKEERDFPALGATSTLSPALAVGALSSKQCINAALAVNQNKLDSGLKGAATWISEIVWREFYRHFLVGFSRVSRGQPFILATRKIRWKDNDDHFEAWREGRTGVPIVDAAMRQLRETGWMHNRLRMIAAMYLTKDLFLDWRLGERFFARSLVDHDLANNNGGWQWSASTGADAAPYFRIFNPYSQSKKYDPKGEFIKKHVPELRDVDARDIHDPDGLPEIARSKLDYPEPLVDHAKARDHAIAAFKKIK